MLKSAAFASKQEVLDQFQLHVKDWHTRTNTNNLHVIKVFKSLESNLDELKTTITCKYQTKKRRKNVARRDVSY